MDNRVAIDIKGLWKRYGLPVPRPLLRVKSLFSKQEKDHDRGQWALKDVSLELRRGETIGVIGQNGAGKSTLLKTLAGVTPPTKGRIELHGRVFPMIELNAGLHPELSGRENVRLLGTIMELSKREIEKKIPHIESFCALKEWFDKPVRTYSSGMLARLGFGVAMNVDAEILLIDEVLAVGDLTFQSKCFQRIESMRVSGVTILFVSHNLRQVDRLCDRVALFHQGRCEQIGTPDKVLQSYYDQCQQLISGSLKKKALKTQGANGHVTVRAIELLNQQGDIVDFIEMLQSVTIRIHYTASRSISHPVFVIGILTPEMLEITNFNTANVNGPDFIEGEGFVDCHIQETRLLPGNYGIKCVIRDHRGLKHFRNEQAAWFRVVSPTYGPLRGNGGVVYTPTEWKFSSEER